MRQMSNSPALDDDSEEDEDDAPGGETEGNALHAVEKECYEKGCPQEGKSEEGDYCWDEMMRLKNEYRQEAETGATGNPAEPSSKRLAAACERETEENA